MTKIELPGLDLHVWVMLMGIRYEMSRAIEIRNGDICRDWKSKSKVEQARQDVIPAGDMVKGEGGGKTR